MIKMINGVKCNLTEKSFVAIFFPAFAGRGLTLTQAQEKQVAFESDLQAVWACDECSICDKLLNEIAVYEKYGIPYNG